MAITTDRIQFNEGELHDVVITIPESIDLSEYEAVIQVRQKPDHPLILEYKTEDDTITRNGQDLLLSILPAQSVGKVGTWQWQLKLIKSSTNIYKFPIYPFVIKSVIVQ